ncbi:hypothetical protein [Pseudomonas sp.]|uniref:hypothetical protein n=1 Tax=Pseudomonas sp. TaxID=306 RepID=UPI00260C610F|nr:hypothetical protein [Pseudomonas sp.]
MAFQKSQGRERLLQAIKIGALEEYTLFGWGVQEASIEYEADEETLKFVTQKSGMTENKGYTLSQSVEQMVYTDDPLFPVLDKIRKEQGIGAKASGQLITINLYESDVEQPASVSGEEFNIGITITSFGGSAEDKLGIGYTINFNSSPKAGTVAITYDPMSFKFTAGSVEE